MNLNERIDQIANNIKQAADELEEEVAKVEEASTTIYKSLEGIIGSIQTMSNTLFAAVEKGFGRSNEEGPEPT